MWTHQQERKPCLSTSLCSGLCLFINLSTHGADGSKAVGCDGDLDRLLHQPVSALHPIALIPQGQSPTVPRAHSVLSGWVALALCSQLLLIHGLSLVAGSLLLGKAYALQGV